MIRAMSEGCRKDKDVEVSSKRRVAASALRPHSLAPTDTIQPQYKASCKIRGRHCEANIAKQISEARRLEEDADQVRNVGLCAGKKVVGRQRFAAGQLASSTHHTDPARRQALCTQVPVPSWLSSIYECHNLGLRADPQLSSDLHILTSMTKSAMSDTIMVSGPTPSSALT